jgi:hypothetical protein
MAAELQQNFPLLMPVPDEAWVRRAVLLAQSLGVLREDDLRDFLGLSARFGEGFLTRAEHQWMLEILIDPAEPDMHQRSRRLLVAAMHHVQQQDNNAKARARFEQSCPPIRGSA